VAAPLTAPDRTPRLSVTLPGSGAGPWTKTCRGDWSIFVCQTSLQS
jgi:hypothetical protein